MTADLPESPLTQSEVGVAAYIAKMRRVVNPRVALAFVLLFLVGATLVCAGVYDRMRIQSVKWRTVTARVVGVRAEGVPNPDLSRKHGHAGRTHFPSASEPDTVWVAEVDYEYTVRSRTYQGTDAWGDSLKDSAGTPREIQVYYNPTNPGDSSYVDPTDYLANTWGPIVAGSVLMVVTLLVAVFVIRIECSDWEPDLPATSSMSDLPGFEVREVDPDSTSLDG